MLTAANGGTKNAFNKMLETAYGRRGKLKWELLEVCIPFLWFRGVCSDININHQPLLTDPQKPLPPPIIRGVEKSRPPVYPIELKNLLCSSFARSTNNALTPQKLEWPPKLPERADPTSEEARLVGPFSKRREVNIRWNYYKTEVKKILPPLQLAVEERRPDGNVVSTDVETIARLGLRPIGFQNDGIFEEALTIAGPAPPLRTLTRRERKALEPGGLTTARPPYFHSIPPGSSLTPRFVRRRFQSLLGKIPILNYTYSTPREGVTPPKGRYTVTQSKRALTADVRFADFRYSDADEEDLEWITSALHKGRQSRDINTE